MGRVLALMLVLSVLRTDSAPCDEIFKAGHETPSKILRCFESFPLDNATKSATLDVAAAVADFYSYTDIAAGGQTPFDVHVDLAKEIEALRGVVHTSDFSFHRDVARLFNRLGDAHTLYSIPTGYNVVWLRPLRLQSYVMGGKQVLAFDAFITLVPYEAFAAAILPASCKGADPSTLTPGCGKVITSINGQPPLNYTISHLAAWGSTMPPLKEVTGLLNSFLDGSTVFTSSWGGVPPDVDRVVFADGSSLDIPWYAYPMHTNYSSGAILAQNSNRPQPASSSPCGGGETHNLEVSMPLHRHVSPLASTATSLLAMGERVAAYPSWEQPEVSCNLIPAKDLPGDVVSGNVSQIAYLRISTFLPNVYRGDLLRQLQSWTSCKNRAAYEQHLAATDSFIGVVVKCVEAAANATPRVPGVVLDVRGNKGGFTSLMNYVLWVLTPTSPPRITPNLELADPPQGSTDLPLVFSTISLRLSDRVLRYPKWIDSFTSGASIRPDGSTPPSMWWRGQLEDLRRGVPSQGTPKFLRVTKYLDAMLEDPVAREVGVSYTPKYAANPASLPTKGFHKMVLLSDGLCGSSCAQFEQRLARSHGVKTLLTGGVLDAVQTSSSFAGGGVQEWTSLRSSLQHDIDEGAPTPPDLPTSASFTFNFQQAFAALADDLPMEWRVSVPHRVLPIFPPFDKDKDLRVLQAAAEVLSETSADSTGWKQVENRTPAEAPGDDSTAAWVYVVIAVGVVVFITLIAAAVKVLSEAGAKKPPPSRAITPITITSKAAPSHAEVENIETSESKTAESKTMEA